MYACEFRKGSPLSSGYVTQKWVPVIPQRKDIVRLGGEMYTVTDRYIGIYDHVVLFIKPMPEIAGDKHWILPRKRNYAREDE